MDNKVLYHHGIKGMKWGERRFQKKDGSLTPAGKKRYSEAIDKAFTPSIKGGKDKPNISPAEKITKESGKILDESSNIIDTASRRKRVDARSLTDKELRDSINRMNLERQYSMLKQEQVSTGLSYTKDILGVVGSVVGIAGSAAAIVSTIKSLRG